MKKLFILALALVATISLSLAPPSPEKCPPGQVRVCETIQPQCIRAPCNPITICHCVGRTLSSKPPFPKFDPKFDPKKCRLGIYCRDDICNCVREPVDKPVTPTPIITLPPLHRIPKANPYFDPKKCRFGVYCGNGWCRCAPERFYNPIVTNRPLPRPITQPHILPISPINDPVIRLPMSRPYLRPLIRKEPLYCPHGYIVYNDGSKSCFHPGIRTPPSSIFSFI